MATKVSPDEVAALTAPKPAPPAAPPEPSPEERLKKEMAEFEVFGPEPEIKVFRNGLKASIGPFTVGQTRQVMPHLTKLMGPLKEMFEAGELNFTTLQTTDWEGLVAIVSIVTGLTPEEVDTLELSEMVWTVVKIVTVNGDFFVRTLPKLLGGAAVAMLVQLRHSQVAGL